MVGRIQKNVRLRVQAVPYAFVNSTIAILMAFAGFLVHDVLVSREGFGYYIPLCCFWMLTNTAIIYVWPKLSEFRWSWKLLFVLMSLQWTGIIYTIIGFYTNSISLEIIPTGFVLIFIGMVSKHRIDKWAGTAVFSLLGTVAMGGAIWQGLEDWTMSAAARASNPEQRVVTRVTLPTWLKVTSGKAAAAAEHSAVGQTWAYAGESGPAMWGKLSAAFAKCSEGTNQSPIDIPRHSPIKQLSFKSRWNQDQGRVTSDGKVVQVDLSAKNQVELDGRNYAVKHLRFHTPSEHQLSGLSYPMEVQFFLEGKSGDLAAIAAFVDIGQPNLEFGKIISALSVPEASKEQQIAKLELQNMLPKEISAFGYTGSYTSPPCTEGVRWNIMRTSIEFSSEQVEFFRRVVHQNARPVQPLGSRSFEPSSAMIAH